MKKQKYERPVINRISIAVSNKFGPKGKIDIISEIDDIPVKELIKKYGSPLYAISEKTVRDTYNRAKQAFSTRYPKVQFAWSYKTNYLKAVCRL